MESRDLPTSDRLVGLDGVLNLCVEGNANFGLDESSDGVLNALFLSAPCGFEMLFK